ncbi:MAG: hypothetical protein Fur0032_06560 [Terrimicrobiaceae bacterium]
MTRILTILLLATCCVAAGAQVPEAAATVVVFNKADVESEALAKYYAAKREIPSKNLIGLECPLDEEITRQEFESAIQLPLRTALFTKGFWKGLGEGGRPVSSTIRFMALIRGIPLKVRHDTTMAPNASQPPAIGARNEASVDSELALLAVSQAPSAGVIENPFFRRLTPAMEISGSPELLLVARLDAPDAATVRSMIDGALAAERDGLWGWGVVDERGIQSGPYLEGDVWLRQAADNMRKQGIPVMVDRGPEVLPSGFPLRQVAAYYGWYETNLVGALGDPGMQFRPGAVAVHIHSFSAATLRSRTTHWCGPLLSRGVAATLGNVYEPYLSLTADLGVFQDRLMAGFTFAESASMSMKVVSWMGVALGDPLYRPYAAWRRMDGPPAKWSSWQTYRRIVLDHSGDVLLAAQPLRQAADKLRNGMFLEALAFAQLDKGHRQEAIKSLEEAEAAQKDPGRTARLAYLNFVKSLSSGDRAGAASAIALARTDGSIGNGLAALMDHRLNPPPPPSPTLSQP